MSGVKENEPDRVRHPVILEIDQLIAECDTRRQRRSGPGGQHRNKVSTGIVLTHRSGVVASAFERRSQSANLRAAVFRLRTNLALSIRTADNHDCPSEFWKARCAGGRVTIGAGHDHFPILLCDALDALARSENDLRDAATLLGCSPSQLVRVLKLDPTAFEQVNRERAALGLHKLK